MQRFVRVTVALAVLLTLVPCGLGTSPSPSQAAPLHAPLTDADPSLCQVSGDKRAAPANLLLGQDAQVTLEIAFSCPQPALRPVDIVLLTDRSGSMTGDPLAAAQAAGRLFIDLLDHRRHRVGIVSFAEEAAVHAQLADGLPRARQALGWLVADGRTNLAAGLRGAAELLGKQRRSEAVGIVVLLSDGVETAGDDPLPAAAALRADGTLLYTIALGHKDEAMLRALAGDAAKAFSAPSPGALGQIYREIAGQVLALLAGELRIEDQMSIDVELLPGSAAPAPAEEGENLLRWAQPDLPRSPLLLNYRVRPRHAGRMPVNHHAVARYIDVDGQERSFVFPVPFIEVALPATPAPRPSTEPSAQPVARPCALYLPSVEQNRCRWEDQPLDVALVIDASYSMEDEGKLDAARQAAKAFVNSLRLPLDRSAIVAFGSRAWVAQTMTGDRQALHRALDNLGFASGTDMSKGLNQARAILVPTPPGRRSVVVLLSDGQSDEAAAQAAARALQAAGVPIFTIGLGSDADGALLSRLALGGRYLYAPGGAQLEGLFQGLAREFVCR